MKRRAFTLIELLVVIAIIGILATIILVSYGNVQAKSRDSKRIADTEALGNAMQMYYVDNKEYPRADTTKVWDRVRSTNIGPLVNNQRWSTKLQGKIQNYITVPIPVDPKNLTPSGDVAVWADKSTDGDLLYTYTASKTAYMIGSKMEVRTGNTATLNKIWLNGCDVTDVYGSDPQSELITTDSTKLQKLYIIGHNLK